MKNKPKEGKKEKTPTLKWGDNYIKFVHTTLKSYYNIYQDTRPKTNEKESKTKIQNFYYK